MVGRIGADVGALDYVGAPLGDRQDELLVRRKFGRDRPALDLSRPGELLTHSKETIVDSFERSRVGRFVIRLKIDFDLATSDPDRILARAELPRPLLHLSQESRRLKRRPDPFMACSDPASKEDESTFSNHNPDRELFSRGSSERPEGEVGKMKARLIL